MFGSHRARARACVCASVNTRATVVVLGEWVTWIGSHWKMNATTCVLNGMLFRVDDRDDALRVDGMRLQFSEGETRIIGLVVAMRCDGSPVAFKLDEVGSRVYVMLTAYTRNVFNKHVLQTAASGASGGDSMRRRRQRDRSATLATADDTTAQMVSFLKGLRCYATDDAGIQCSVCFSNWANVSSRCGHFMCARCFLLSCTVGAASTKSKKPECPECRQRLADPRVHYRRAVHAVASAPRPPGGLEVTAVT